MDLSSPPTERIKAIDVVEHRWGLWSSIRDGTPFTNPIVAINWSEDRSRLSFMFESFNFMLLDPDEMLELVPLDTSRYPAGRLQRAEERHAQLVASRLSKEDIQKRAALVREVDRLRGEIRKLDGRTSGDNA